MSMFISRAVGIIISMSFMCCALSVYGIFAAFENTDNGI